MVEAALSFSDVCVVFGKVRALDGLSLEVYAGRIVALVGPNGAGKTTTLRAACGLVRPSSGVVSVLGTDPVSARRWSAYLPDRPVLPQYLTVSELLKLRAGLWGMDQGLFRREVERLVDELALDGLLGVRCGRLSHGQAQKAALAAVLVTLPKVILVDEPMTALDLEAQQLVAAALARRAEEGSAVLLATHTISLVSKLADSVALISKGKVVAARDAGDDPGELERWVLGKLGS